MSNPMTVPAELIAAFPEINPRNYSHEDACALNAWGVELVLAAAPQAKEQPSALAREDLRINAYQVSRNGGWDNSMPSGIRIIHLPTGVEVSCESERSAHANREKAMAEIRRAVALARLEASREPASAPVGYCIGRMLAKLGSGLVSGISLIDVATDGHDTPVYAAPQLHQPALEELERAVVFLEACKRDSSSVEVGAMRDAKEWVESAAVALVAASKKEGR